MLTSAATAAKRLEIAPDRLVLLEGHLAPDVALPSIGTLIDEHEKYPPYTEHCFKPGEAKTAVAFLYFSSGTTGNPKASMRYNINPLLSCVVPFCYRLFAYRTTTSCAMWFRTRPTIASTRRIPKGKTGATVQETAVAEVGRLSHHDLSTELMNCCDAALPLFREWHTVATISSL